MKKIIGFSFLVLFSLFSYGQSQEGTVEYRKKLQPAAVIELPYPPSVVYAAMNDHLSKKDRSKGDDMKGFTTYRNTQLLQSDSSNADLYFKIGRKSRKEKKVTIIYLLLMPNDVQINSSDLHYLSMAEARNYLNKLAEAIGSYNLELTIKDQNDALVKAEAKYKSLTDEGKDLNKKRTAIDRKIEENINNQNQQLKEVENQKQKLAQWVSQRKS